MDLTITKSHSFQETGTVHTKTFRKPSCKPQYLAFTSQHKLSAKLGIFKSEAMRHMMNCSDKDEYMRRIVELQAALESRGYPRPVLQSPAYDAGKRTAFFTRILQRQRQPQESGRPGDVIVFKTEYSPSLRHIRIRAEYTRLVRHLQTLLGREFLQDHRLVVANPSRNSLFLETYCFNYVSTDKSIMQRSG